MLAHICCLVDVIVTAGQDRPRGEAFWFVGHAIRICIYFLSLFHSSFNDVPPSPAASHRALNLGDSNDLFRPPPSPPSIFALIPRPAFFPCFFFSLWPTHREKGRDNCYSRLRSRVIEASFGSIRSVFLAWHVKFDPSSDRVIDCRVSLSRSKE